MKRIALVLSLALAVAPTVASAQIGFGLSAGLAVPMSSLSDSYSSGYHVQGSVSISPPLMPVGFRIDGTYDNFAIKSSLASSGSVGIAGLSGNVIFGLGGILVGPYVLGGVGMYHYSSTIGTAPSTSGNKPGLQAGAGLKFGVGDLGASVEAKYVFINTDTKSTQFVPITFGISF